MNRIYFRLTYVTAFSFKTEVTGANVLLELIHTNPVLTGVRDALVPI